MATSTATKPVKQRAKEFNFSWEGKDKSGKAVRGEMRAGGENVVQVALRRQGVINPRIKKLSYRGGRKITEKDITIFSRQMATMMKAGVPLLQSFDIVAKGHSNPAMSKLLIDIRSDVETGSSLSQAFRRYPLYFDALFCNLVAAGEQAGILDTLLDRLATYMEKNQAIKAKIKGALFYPTAVVVVAFIIVAVIMIWVVPAFKQVFTSFGADLPAPTLMVMAISDFFVRYWYLIFATIGGGIYFTAQSWRRSLKFRHTMDRWLLRAPIFGELVRKATIARWTNTLATMFSAGVPLVEALDSVGGASGNQVYVEGTKRIQTQVSTGSSLTSAMQDSQLFPNMVTQMTAIGEESGSLDHMLTKVAEFYEREVDDMVKALSSLMEPVIMVFLGVIIGGLVVAMYLPIFKLGAVV